VPVLAARAWSKSCCRCGLSQSVATARRMGGVRQLVAQHAEAKSRESALVRGRHDNRSSPFAWALRPAMHVSATAATSVIARKRRRC
jgi:hypothetical protein